VLNKSRKKIISFLIGAIFICSNLFTPFSVIADDQAPVIEAPSSPSYTNTVLRLGGYDRFGTAIAVADYGWTNATYAILAPAGNQNMVDALASSSLSKAIDGPVLLTDKDSLTPETLAELKRLGVKNVYIVSGTAVISEMIEFQLAKEGIATLRLGGKDRYETAVNIAKELHKISPFNHNINVFEINFYLHEMYVFCFEMNKSW